MKKYLLIFMLFPLLASAQLKMKVITGPWGLVTSKGDFNTEPWELRVAHDVNLSRNGVGTFSPRRGSIEIFRFPGADSIIGLSTISYRDGTEQLIAAVDSAVEGYANIYVSVLNSDQFGAKVDSTEVLYNTVAYDAYILANDDDTIVMQHIFNIKRPGPDIQVTIHDTIYNSADWLESNDTMVARINAHATLMNYATADSTGDIEDTAYFYLNDKADTAVTFSWNAKGLRLGGLIGDALISTQIFETSTDFTPNERIATHWGVQSSTRFAQLKDKTYIVNGQQKGLVFNGDYTSPWPMNAPGEITVVPLAFPDSSDNLADGEYRYLILYSSDSTSFIFALSGYLTPPVKITDGKILLKEFGLPAHLDSLPTQVNDTFAVKIYRTFVNPGQLTRSDSVFLHSTHTFLTHTDNSIYNFTVIDSIADASLGAALPIVIPDTTIDFSARVVKNFGAPLMAYAISGSSVGKIIFEGTSSATTGVSYIVTFVDTANGTESDSSRPLYVERDVGGNEDQYIIGLPVANTAHKVFKNIYRANVITASWDTLSILQNQLDTTSYVTANGVINTRVTPVNLGGLETPIFTTTIKPSNQIVDKGNYRLVAQVADSQRFFHDSIPYDSLLGQPQKFSAHPIPSGLEHIFVDNGRLFGSKGSRMYFSRTGLLNQWELFDFRGFNADDGSQITMGLPFRGGILVGKHFSVFNWTNINNKEIELAGVAGCIASRSAIQANGSNYYMSNRGVIALSEGAALLRYHQSELLSKPLNNFLKLPFEDLSLAVGAYVPQTEQLWWCIGDTTYVYDYESDKWATSSLTFGGTTLWDTDTAQEFRPGRSLYFYEQGDSVLYRFGVGNRVKGGQTFVNMKVESGPIFKDAIKQQIFNFAIWAQPEETYALAALNFLNEDDVLTGNWILPRVNRRVSYKDMYNNPATYYRFTIQSLQASFPMTDGGIDRIDIWYDDISEPFWE